MQQNPSNPQEQDGFSFHGDGQAMMASVDTGLGDTGASHHTLHDINIFFEFQQLARPYIIQQVQGEVTVSHSGAVKLTVYHTYMCNTSNNYKIFT